MEFVGEVAEHAVVGGVAGGRKAGGLDETGSFAASTTTGWSALRAALPARVGRSTCRLSSRIRVPPGDRSRCGEERAKLRNAVRDTLASVDGRKPRFVESTARLRETTPSRAAFRRRPARSPSSRTHRRRRPLARWPTREGQQRPRRRARRPTGSHRADRSRSHESVQEQTARTALIRRFRRDRCHCRRARRTAAGAATSEWGARSRGRRV
jgi:hypothetical protein